MDIGTDKQVIIFLVAVFLLLVWVLVSTIRKKGKGGSGFITAMAATYELQTKDRQEAVQELSEIKTNKMLESFKKDEQISGEKENE